MTDKTSVLFVCLGNICRSTMAEGIFRHLAAKPEWKDKIGRIDSCGTGIPHPHVEAAEEEKGKKC